MTHKMSGAIRKTIISLSVCLAMLLSAVQPVFAGDAYNDEKIVRKGEEETSVIDPIGDWYKYDALIESIRAETDTAKRLDMLHEAEDMLMSTYCVIPIYYYDPAEGYGTFFIAFNAGSELFKGMTAEQAASFREAFSLLLNRKEIINSLSGDFKTANAFVPLEMPDGNGGIYKTSEYSEGYFHPLEINLHHDQVVEKARECLRNAGYRFDENGMLSSDTPLDIVYVTNDNQGVVNVSEKIAECYAEIGINLIIEVSDWETSMNIRKEGSFDICRAGWIADYDDPLAMLEIFTTDCEYNDCHFGQNPSWQSGSDWSEYSQDELLYLSNLLTGLQTSAYVYARLLTEKYVEADFGSMSLDEAEGLYRECVEAWEAVLLISDKNTELLGEIDFYEEPGAAESALGSTENDQGRFLTGILDFLFPVTVAYADSGNEKAIEFAKKINEMYDKTDRSKKNSERFKELAEQMGTDARSVVKAYIAANELLSGEYKSEADYYKNAETVCQVIKTGSKVGLFVCGVIASGGTVGLSGITLAQGTGVMGTLGAAFTGADCMVDIAATGSNIILGEDNVVTQTLTRAEGYLGTASSLFSLCNLVDTTAMVLNSGGIKNLMNLAISDQAAVVDSINFVVDNVRGLYQENTLFGIELPKYQSMDVSDTERSTQEAVGLYDIENFTEKTPEEIRQIAEAAGAPSPVSQPRTVDEVLDSLEYTTEDIIEAYNVIIPEEMDWDAFEDYIDEILGTETEEPVIVFDDSNDEDQEQPGSDQENMIEVAPEEDAEADDYGISGTYSLFIDWRGANTTFNGTAEVSLYDDNTMHILLKTGSGDDDLLKGTYDPQTKVFRGIEDSTVSPDEDDLIAILSQSSFAIYTTSLVFDTDSVPITARGALAGEDSSEMQPLEQFFYDGAHMTLELTKLNSSREPFTEGEFTLYACTYEGYIVRADAAQTESVLTLDADGTGTMVVNGEVYNIYSWQNSGNEFVIDIGEIIPATLNFGVLELDMGDGDVWYYTQDEESQKLINALTLEELAEKMYYGY